MVLGGGGGESYTYKYKYEPLMIQSDLYNTLLQGTF